MRIIGKPDASYRRLITALMAEACRCRPGEDAVDALLDSGVIIEYAPGEDITPEGAIDPDVYMLVEGIIRSWYWDGDVEKTAYFGTPGTLCVSYHGYVFGQPAPGTHQACCRSRLFKVAKADYDRLIAEDHSFARWCLEYANCQLYYFEMKRNLINGSARERYESLLRNRPEIIRGVPLKIIASYLGITPQYLSKLRRDMR